jgi:hypothetical protein
VTRIVVANENGPDLEFEGEQLVDGAHGRLGMVEVWRTAGGRYVARRRQAAHRGRPYIHAVEIFDTLEALGEWLGASPDAKRLCEKLGHRRVTTID